MNKRLLKMTAVILLCVAFSACKKDEPAGPATPQAPLKSETFTVGDVCFDLVEVEGGTFQMGGTREQMADALADEFPVHKVTLSTYSIGKTEVTQALWEAVMGSNPSFIKGDSLPVENVSWEDCQKFIIKLNYKLSAQLKDRKFALPTEAQWEYAARGGKRSCGFRYAGANTPDDVAWCKENSDNTTHAVAQKTANELGLYDMSGNVSEWCMDYYVSSYSNEDQVDPMAETGKDRLRRGGSCYQDATSSRVSCRSFLPQHSASVHSGLRLVLLPADSNGGSGDDTTAQQLRRFSFTVNNVSFTMIEVKGDTFRMGAYEDIYASDDEKPSHSVLLSDYCLGETEVTQALWMAVMDTNPSTFVGSNLPVQNVNWVDCQVFIDKLNKLLATSLDGKKFCLPTEAQWEFAARAGTKTSLYSGENLSAISSLNAPNLDPYAWYGGNCGQHYTAEEGCDMQHAHNIARDEGKQYEEDTIGGPHPVGMKKPNAWGFYDMLGNVWEMCSNWSYTYGVGSTLVDPAGPNTGTKRVRRGGGWINHASYCRVSYRSFRIPINRENFQGFRLALQ